ncbi:hypothetical protein VTJ04DRAFT_2202 [Mycothermus thermophilus]|uniref:uncharacterized protein n=1 Tax=Humicola insolens TaxID=85995 RepID=UPI0037429ACB
MVDPPDLQSSHAPSRVPGGRRPVSSFTCALVAAPAVPSAPNVDVARLLFCWLSATSPEPSIRYPVSPTTRETYTRLTDWSWVWVQEDVGGRQLADLENEFTTSKSPVCVVED